jgi:type I restriction enzyme, S subunit
MSGVAEVSAKYLAEEASNTIPIGFKQTDVGLIPEDWKCITLGEIGDIVRGGSPRPAGDSRFFNGDFIPWLTVASLTNIPASEIYVTETISKLTELGSLQSRTLEKGTLIISNSGATLGVAKILGIKCCANDGVAAIINQKMGVREFLVYYFNTQTKKLHDQVATGNGQPNLNTDLIKSISVPFPNEKEQTAIANALSDVDALISELEKLITKKQAIKTATMQQLLTGRTRLPQFALREDGTPKGTKPSELGEIPEDWEAVALKDLLKESPKYGINAPAVPLEGKLPVYIRITDISEDGYFKPTEKVGVKSPFSDLYQLADGDLVLARTGASVGKSYLYRLEDGVLVYAGFLIKVTPEQSKLDPKFLFQYLQTERYWSWVTVNSMRSGQPGINGNEYGSLMLPWPEKDEQTAIATILSDMDTEIQALEQRLGKTRQIKQGMMQELLTGKTRLIKPAKEVIHE